MMMRSAIFIAGLLIGLGSPESKTLQTSSADESKDAFVIIVHPKNTAARLDKKFLSDAFFKKTTRWPNDMLIKPVDQRSDAEVRQAFSNAIMGRSVSAVKVYWQHAIFSGRDVPPPELESDSAVIQYVLKNPGAVGYIASNTNPGGAKVISVK